MLHRKLSMSSLTTFKAVNLPKRIILIRHGESLGNAQESAYASIPDWKIPLTERGVEQSRQLGVAVKEIVGTSPLFIYCSPYKRTRDTLKHMMHALEDNQIIGAREEPRITEQQFGNFQNEDSMQEIKAERFEFGRFYYRFPQGEAGLDVYNRVTSFISTLFRDWSRNDSGIQNDMTVIVVTHGLTLRLFLMRWYQYTVREFEESVNPQNASIIIMDRVCDSSTHYSHFRVNQEGLDNVKFTDKSYLWNMESDIGRDLLNSIIN